MRFGMRKVVVAAAAATVLALALLALRMGELGLLLVLLVLVQVAGFALLGQIILDARRTVERKVEQIHASTTAEIRSAIAADTFVERLRSAALPQQHADQLLRTLEARNTHIESALDQLSEKIDRALQKREGP